MNSPQTQSSPVVSPKDLFGLLAGIILFDIGFIFFLFSELSLPVGLPLLVVGFIVVTKFYPTIVKKVSVNRMSFIGLVLMMIAGVVVPPLVAKGNFVPLLIGLIGPILFVLGVRKHLSGNTTLIWLVFFAAIPAIAVIVAFFKSLGIFLGE